MFMICILCSLLYYYFCRFDHIASEKQTQQANYYSCELDFLFLRY